MKDELPDPAQMKAAMNSVSERIKEWDERLGNLARKYGVHGEPFSLSVGGRVRVTRVGEGWGLYYDEGPDEAVRALTGCRIEVKIEFLRRAKEIAGAYEARIVQLHETLSKTLVDVDADEGRRR